MTDLNIDVICANTPAAKGRVERAHQRLQDRLVKELRLRGICTMDDANRYLPEFIEDYNRRFARAVRKRQQQEEQELVRSAKSKREQRIVRDRFADRLPPPGP